MKQSLLFLAVFSFAINVHSQTGICNMPFPRHTKYATSTILPHADKKLMSDSTMSFFNQWQRAYIKYKNYGNESCAYVFSKDTAKEKDENKDQDYDCVSEALGYGMIIVVQMSDSSNSKANQVLFNQLFRFYKRHPSIRDKEGITGTEQSILMGYGIHVTKEGNDVYETAAASDGDIDIAYSLLLADAQWSSTDTINYLKEAGALIKTIYAQDINKHTRLILTSNENEDDNHIKTAIKQKYYDIRTSDFIPSELKAFNTVLKDGCFGSVVDSSYKYFFAVQSLGDKHTGLVPDFVQHIGDTIQGKGYRIIIPPKDYEKEKNAGKYFYNACRVPWRIATDYIVSGDIRAKNFVEPINNWIRSICKDDPNNINAGYTLDGKEILKDKERDTRMMSFVSPFAVSSMVDQKNQPWLDKLWDSIVKLPLTNVEGLKYGYFENTIKMLDMIILSGNYWSVSK